MLGLQCTISSYHKPMLVNILHLNGKWSSFAYLPMYKKLFCEELPVILSLFTRNSCIAFFSLVNFPCKAVQTKVSPTICGFMSKISQEQRALFCWIFTAKGNFSKNLWWKCHCTSPSLKFNVKAHCQVHLNRLSNIAESLKNVESLLKVCWIKFKSV